MNKREVRSTPHTFQKTKAIPGSDQWFGQCWVYSFKRQLFSSGALLYVFEDNEAVIKMIIKGRIQNPQSCSWLVVRTNQFGPQNPNQIHRHQKPTRRHLDKGEFHTWWVESSFCVCPTLAISVLPIVLKWCRKEHKKIQVKKESQQNRSRWWIWSRVPAQGSRTCYLLLHQKALGKNQVWKSITSELVDWATSKNRETTLTHQITQSGMLTRIGLLKSGNLMNLWK